jgi:NADPH-dependent curcumin reductase CurA
MGRMFIGIPKILLMSNLIVKRIKILGYIVFDEYGHGYDEFSQVMSQWLK